MIILRQAQDGIMNMLRDKTVERPGRGLVEQ
jgi:hypothetical protein